MKKFVYLIAFLLFSACTSSLPESGSGNIVGIVADKTTGEPIAKVNVILEDSGASTVTGTDGNFSFQNLQAGNYTLLLRKEGYKDVRHTVSVSGSQATESHLLIERIPGLLTLDRDELDFGENYSNNTLSFSMVNKNYEDLDWTIVHNCSWIVEINPSQSVTPLRYGKTQTVVVIIDRDKLLPGNNETTIVVRTTEGGANLMVKAFGQQRRMASVNTLAATEVYATSAILNAEIIDAGFPDYTERGFVVGTNDRPTKETALFVLPVSPTSDKNFSARVWGLSLDKIYKVRAYAINEEGIAYSVNQVQFTTSPALPRVTIQPAESDFKTRSVSLKASIVDAGDPEYTERGFVYSDKYNTPTIADEIIVIAGSGIGGFEKRVDLSSYSAKVYFRAYAKNVKGVAYSETTVAFDDYVNFPSAKLGVQTVDISTSLVDYSSANSLCANSNVGGYLDWHLPTKDELATVYNLRNECGLFVNSIYWTSTRSPGGAHYYVINMSSGNEATMSPSNMGRVRCVRTLSE